MKKLIPKSSNVNHVHVYNFYMPNVQGVFLNLSIIPFITDWSTLWTDLIRKVIMFAVSTSACMFFLPFLFFSVFFFLSTCDVPSIDSLSRFSDDRSGIISAFLEFIAQWGLHGYYNAQHWLNGVKIGVFHDFLPGPWTCEDKAELQFSVILSYT